MIRMPVRLVILLLVGSLMPTTYVVASEQDSTDRKIKYPGLVKKILKYFEDANTPQPEKKLDISFIGGPEYSKEKGFGLGLVGEGLYYTKRNDNELPTDDTPASTVALKLEVTTGQLYRISAEGINILPSDRCRLNYEGDFFYFKDKFWGIGYTSASKNDNESEYRRLEARLKVDFVWKFGQGFFLGPLSQFSYVNATQVSNLLLFRGESLRTFTTGIGITATYDTRDIPYNAYTGIWVRFRGLYNPAFIANKYTFTETEFTMAAYRQVWTGGVLASQFHADLTFGNTPWGLMPSLGGKGSGIRGYYEGRYRDKCEADFVIELRQHVWRRNGIVLWAGIGTVFPKFSALTRKMFLPNAGIGYRWQFKGRTNVRLDFGIGKGETGINFSINEAF